MQYQTEKFLIVKNIKKFILDLEKILVNFPRKEFLTKDKIYSDALSVLELTYNANEVKDLNEKRKIQIKIIVKLNMLDFYMERAYKNRYISEKQCVNKCAELNNISKMVYKWIMNGRIC